MTKRFVAGLLVLSEDETGRFALLQKRGDWDYEQNRWESYPGGCQVTCLGGVEPEDQGDREQTMLREADQELGPDFVRHLAASPPQHLITVQTDVPEREATFYWTRLPAAAIATIRLHPSSGGLVRMRPGTPMLNMYTAFSREGGIPDRRIIAAYPETIQAVECAFALAQS